MKISEKLDISITNYIGQLENGVVVLLSIIYDEKSYEATYWYDGEYKLVTLDEELESEIGQVEELSEYQDILKFLDDSTPNFTEIYETLNPISE